MDFQHGVKLDLNIETGDNLVAATLASILKAAVTVRQTLPFFSIGEEDTQHKDWE